MTESALQLLVLIRFLCFVAVVYLGLHIVFSRLISKSDSKILWFFSVITLPLTWPVRAWLAPGTPESRLRFAALLLYVVLWVLLLVATEMAASTRIERLADIRPSQYSGHESFP